MIPCLESSSPAILCILVLSSASSFVIGGSIEGIHLESIVLPAPGGPIIRTL